MSRIGKKGVTVMQLGQVAMIIVLVAVTTGIGVWVNEELYSTAYDTTTVSNESVTFAANDTYYDLTHKAKTITFLDNATSGTMTENINFTKRDYGYITQVKVHNDDIAASVIMNVTYESYQSDAHYATMNATTGISNLAQWLPIVAIVIAASVILSALALWFGRR